MALSITLAADDVQVKLSNGAATKSDASWLPEYRALVATMVKSPDQADKTRSRWFGLTLGADDSPRTTPRRLTTAAKEKGFSVQTKKAEQNDQGVSMWVRLIPPRPPKGQKAS